MIKPSIYDMGTARRCRKMRGTARQLQLTRSNLRAVPAPTYTVNNNKRCAVGGNYIRSVSVPRNSSVEYVQNMCSATPNCVGATTVGNNGRWELLSRINMASSNGQTCIVKN